MIFLSLVVVAANLYSKTATPIPAKSITHPCISQYAFAGEAPNGRGDIGGQSSEKVLVLDGGEILSSLKIDEQCGSGQPGHLTIRAAPGARVRITGSTPLGPPLDHISGAANALLAPEARGHVLAYALDPATERRFLAEPPKSPTVAPAAGVMLTQGGAQLVDARWPQEGYANAAALPGAPQSPAFTPPSERTAAWGAEPALRAGGYWSYDWAFETVRMKVNARTSIAVGARLTSPYALAKRYRYFVYNAISELRAPGEFAVSPDTHELLVWPFQDGAGAPPVRLVRADHLLEIADARNVTIEGIEFTDCLDTAVEVDGSSHVVFRNDLVANAGGAGIVIAGGDHNTIERTVVTGTGSSGVVLSGGDRGTLTPAGHRLSDSIVVQTGERARSNHAAVQLLGVGNTVVGSLIVGAPHSGIQFAGNDHSIAFNEIADTVTETADAGAVYTGRDTSARGNVIEHNFIHDVYPRKGAPPDVRGIYLDDFTSGDVVRANVFYKVRDAIYLNGGSDNIIAGNIFVDVTGAPVTSRDAAGQWAPEFADLKRNGEAAIQNPRAYARKYAGFKPLSAERPGVPRNLIVDNVIGYHLTPFRSSSLSYLGFFDQAPIRDYLIKQGFLKETIR